MALKTMKDHCVPCCVPGKLEAAKLPGHTEAANFTALSETKEELNITVAQKRDMHKPEAVGIFLPGAAFPDTC